jgi:SAM-dependent methyltransferase
MTETSTADSVYYKDLYWNDHPLVLEHLCKRLSGGLWKRGQWMTQYFKDLYAGEKPFERTLILNCGNGWVERELFDAGVLKNVVAFDYSNGLLEQARAAADGRPFEYFQADCNKIELEADSFDLVVNLAAMHHVQYINRLSRIIASCLKRDGYFLNFDYIGPHRNQYSDSQWSFMQEVYSRLPANLQGKELRKPDLTQMLIDDPTEAIHSELILENFYRYFIPVERKDLGGGIAYQIMHNNHVMFVRNEETDQWVYNLIELDSVHTDLGTVPSLFSYFVGRPNKDLLDNFALMESLQRAENEREDAVKKNGGRYSNF